MRVGRTTPVAAATEALIPKRRMSATSTASPDSMTRIMTPSLPSRRKASTKGIRSSRAGPTMRPIRIEGEGEGEGEVWGKGGGGGKQANARRIDI